MSDQIEEQPHWAGPSTESSSLLGIGEPVRGRLNSDAKVPQLFTASEVFLARGTALAVRKPDESEL